MLALVFIVSILALIAGYLFYGRWVAKTLGIDPGRRTPSHELRDDVDYSPARWQIVLGHHFSSIAGAGPIVGPVIAATVFGWAPVYLWILFGSILIGAVHDFSSLFVSLRNRARSIAEVAREHLSPFSHALLLIYILFTLIYVLVVFADLTAYTFSVDGAVTTSSMSYILLAIVFGLFIYRLKTRFVPTTIIFVALVFFAVWLGGEMPFTTSGMFGIKKFWSVILIIYCIIASVTPVWILLQPRDYLSSFLLYACIIGGSIGLIFGNFPINYPVFTSFQTEKLGDLVPILFITVACGAVSGFHSIVASGTTAKQLNSESDAKPVAYGGMLIEGALAVIAMSAVAVISTGSEELSQSPVQVFAAGMGKFFSILGLSVDTGSHFAVLALSAFLLTTLDTCTRLARYIFEELFRIKGKNTRFFSTIGVIVLPTVLVLIDIKDASGDIVPAWKAIWPIFGSSNQLLAGLALLVVTLWLKRSGRKYLFTLIPMFFMVIMTVWSLVLLVLKNSGLRGVSLNLVGIIAFVLLILALFLVIEILRVIFSMRKENIYEG